MFTSRKALLSICLVLMVLLSSVFAATIYAQDPTAEPVGTAEPGTTDPAATTEAGGTTGQTGTGIICDNTTISMLVIAKYFGYDTSAQAVDVTQFDLGEAQIVYDAIQPMQRVEGVPTLDDVMNDPTMGQEFLTYLESIGTAEEGATTLSPISAEGEDPACLALRDSATQFVLLSILYGQMGTMGQ